MVTRASFAMLAMGEITIALFCSCARGAGYNEIDFADLSALRRPRIPFKSSALRMSVVDVRPPDKEPYVVVTPIADEMFEHGIAPEAIAGTFRGTPDITGQQAPRPEDFIPGPLFTNFLQNIIARYAPDVPEYRSQA